MFQGHELCWLILFLLVSGGGTAAVDRLQVGSRLRELEELTGIAKRRKDGEKR